MNHQTCQELRAPLWELVLQPATTGQLANNRVGSGNGLSRGLLLAGVSSLSSAVLNQMIQDL
jgi:hypothetical protein